MRAILVVLVLLGGCGSVDRWTPPWEGTEVDSPVGSDVAIDIVVSFYADRMNANPPNHVGVQWVSDPFVYDHGLRNGLYISCDSMVVTISGADFPIHRTALAHEIGHCMGGDGNHEDPMWWAPGGIVELANNELSAAGL